MNIMRLRVWRYTISGPIFNITFSRIITNQLIITFRLFLNYDRFLSCLLNKLVFPFVIDLNEGLGTWAAEASVSSCVLVASRVWGNLVDVDLETEAWEGVDFILKFLCFCGLLFKGHLVLCLHVASLWVYELFGDLCDLLMIITWVLLLE